MTFLKAQETKEKAEDIELGKEFKQYKTFNEDVIHNWVQFNKDNTYLPSVLLFSAFIAPFNNCVDKGQAIACSYKFFYNFKAIINVEQESAK